MALRVFPCSKDVPVRSQAREWSATPREGAPGREHLYAGRLPKRLHRSFLDFAFDFSEVSVIHTAELCLYTSEADNEVLSGAKARVYRVTHDWNEQNSNEAWQENTAINPSVATGVDWTGAINPSPGGISRIDITSLMGHWAPARIRWEDSGGVLQPGKGQDRFGLRLQCADEDDPDKAFEVWSSEAPDPDKRPFIEISYTPSNQGPDAVTTISPDGTTLPGEPFTGEYQDPDNDPPSGIDVQVRRASNSEVVWTGSFGSDPLWPEAGGIWTWSVPNPGPGWLHGNTDYEWRAKGYDGRGGSSAWTGWRAFRQEGTVPTVALVPIGGRDTLAGVLFQVGMSVGPGLVPVSCRVQLKDALDPWTNLLWDELFIPLTVQEKAGLQTQRLYGGVSLTAGDYAWRALVTDSLGVPSEWSEEDVFSLSIGSEAEAEWGQDPSKTTAYTRSKQQVRVVLRDMSGAGRGPGIVKAIIENPENLGISAYVNEPGEMYFTLPAIHPQASECEPYQRHYAVQQYRNSNWLDIANGILTDFDATDDDIVIYGIDYLGLLSLSVDTRLPTADNYNEDQREPGGAKYVDEQISYIVQDQLERAAADADSPTGFMNIGNIDELDSRVHIFCSFVQRLDFIRGLLDSHRQGTGIRSRLKARKDPSQADRWEWDLSNNPGFDRDNLRLEYGSLVQSFRVIGMGSFGTRAHGLGREPTSVKPEYHMYPAEGASNSLTGLYGNIQKVEVWQDIVDRNDLKRRVRQLYQESIKVGKRIALGLRVHSLNPWDGFDLTDNIPLDIDRGMVETQRYGSGYWTIWGQEYRVYPDGHDELTLVIRPKEDGEPADPDLLPGDEIDDSQGGWCFGNGPPGPKCKCKYYIDLDTYTIYECKQRIPEPQGEDKPWNPPPWSFEFVPWDDYERGPDYT